MPRELEEEFEEEFEGEFEEGEEEVVEEPEDENITSTVSLSKWRPNIVTQALHFWEAPKLVQRKRNPLARMLSLEIEMQSFSAGSQHGDLLRKSQQAWNFQVGTDGSLGTYGFELRTAPAGGDYFIRQLEELDRLFTLYKPVVDAQCGLHVHADCRDVHFADLEKIILAYCSIEPILFSLTDAKRQKNRFCVPCASKLRKRLERHEILSKKDLAVELYNDQSTQQHKREHYVATRYYALNVHSWFYRKTLECRIFEGTTRYTDLLNWGLLWGYFIQWALNETRKEIVKALDKPASRNRALILSIMPPHVREWIRTRWQSDLYPSKILPFPKKRPLKLLKAKERK